MPAAPPLEAPPDETAPDESSSLDSALDQTAPAEPIVRPRVTPKDKKRPKRQPPYAVVLHNDDLNTMGFVVGVLRKVFGYGTAKAMRLMMTAHATGRANVWTGTRELAELKAEQLKSCGADPAMAEHGATTLGVTVEPLPGE